MIGHHTLSEVMLTPEFGGMVLVLVLIALHGVLPALWIRRSRGLPWCKGECRTPRRCDFVGHCFLEKQ